MQEKARLRFPLYAIVDKEFTESKLPDGMMNQQTSNYGRCLMLFTTDQLARDGITEYGGSSVRVLSILEPNAMLTILLSLQQAGDTHVGLDISTSESEFSLGVGVIADWIAACRKWGQ